MANPQPRQYDVSALLGQAFCHVAFQERFSINDDEWNDLFEARWFPFIGLRDETINTLLSHVRNGWEPDEKLDDILSETKVRVPQMLQSWRNCHSFSPHIEILKSAVERFQNDDFVSCTASLFPRIEGILRTHHDSLGKQVSPSPTNLVDSAVDTIIQNPRSLLLPARFRSYLEDVYFANFDPAKPNIGVSRHSVAHGVADQSSFNKKSAVILAYSSQINCPTFLEGIRIQAIRRKISGTNGQPQIMSALRVKYERRLTLKGRVR